MSEGILYANGKRLRKQAFVSDVALAPEKKTPARMPAFMSPRDDVSDVLFVVVLVVFIIVVFDARVPHGAATTLATLHRDDNRARLHLRTSVEHNDSLAGGAQQALVFENLEYAARHFARAAYKA
jgi:hypothetical protein